MKTESENQHQANLTREPNDVELSADEMAVKCAAIMWAQDLAPKSMGMTLGPISNGRAQLSMKIRSDMINGHNICHGGLIFALADTAFAYACNGYNQITLAQHCSVSFLKMARMGEVLTAKAVEKTRQGRSGIYDVAVSNENNEIIAEFRGISRAIKGKLYPSCQ